MCSTISLTAPVAYDISPEVLQRAAQQRYGAGVQVSAPDWVTATDVRVGILMGDVSFGANFDFQVGLFH